MPSVGEIARKKKTTSLGGGAWRTRRKSTNNPYPRRDLETSPKTRGRATRVRPWIYGPLIKHTSHNQNVPPHVFFLSRGRERSIDHRRSFPYFYYSLVTSKQTPAPITRPSNWKRHSFYFLPLQKFIPKYNRFPIQ